MQQVIECDICGEDLTDYQPIKLTNCPDKHCNEKHYLCSMCIDLGHCKE